MSILFDPMRIKGIALRNRFVRSATYDGCADSNGHVTGQQIELYKELAKGGVGLIVTGLTYVHPSGQFSSAQNSITDDGRIPGLRQLTHVAHNEGAAIAVQLAHAGREAARFLEDKGDQATAPSYVPNDPYFARRYRAMTEEEIWDIVRAFGDAAARAKVAGFDAVQLHAAHAYLGSQFLSPFANRRGDCWGGSLENRLRFHREVLRDIKAKVGEDYPVLVKLGVQDGFEGGLEFTDGREAARLLAEWGYDALEISQGLRGKQYEETEFRVRINSVAREAYFRCWCKAVKKVVDMPVMMVGGLRTFELMEEIVRQGEADFISLCRPFIREPGIVREWAAGDHHRAACISCNTCLDGIREGETLRCPLH